MSCNPTPVTLEVPLAVTHTLETAPVDVTEVLETTLATGYAFQNPCCNFGFLQILYGMPILFGQPYKYGSTV